MPTPVGHSLFAYLFARHLRLSIKPPVLKWTLFIVVANAPDLDLIPGFLTGNPNTYHHNFTHSLGFAIFFALSISIYFRVRKNPHWAKYGGWVFLIYFSHVFFDLFGNDTSLPYGEPFFWPLSSVYIVFPYPFLLDIHKSSDSATFLWSLINWHNFQAILLEVGVFFVLLFLIEAGRLLLRRRKLAR